MTHPVPESADLLGAVAYGELAAFTRLAADADRAPDLAGRTELATLAAVEMDHFRRVRDHLAGRGVDVGVAMAPFVAPLDAFHHAVAPRDWPEALVVAHLGRGLADDLQSEILAWIEGVDDEVAALVRDVLADAGHGAFVEREVRAACADVRVRDRLALAARRLLGEALAGAAAVLDEHPKMAVIVVGPEGGGRAAMFKRMKSRHGKRMSALGL